jgi:hypothetical protein
MLPHKKGGFKWLFLSNAPNTHIRPSSKEKNTMDGTIVEKNAEPRNKNCKEYTILIEDPEDIELLHYYVRGLAEEILLSKQRKRIIIRTL